MRASSLGLIQIIGFGVLLWSQSLVGASGKTWHDDVSLLPQYCKDKVKGGESLARWRKVLGTAFIHIHHYCDGSHAEIKAKLTTDKRERKYFLQKVKGEMKYVSGPCKTDCVLYPELHTRWGWALAEEGEISEAIKHYRLAIQAKPTYKRAYIQLSELYIKLDLADGAREILEEGLKANPKSRALKRRISKLDKTE